MSTPLFDSLIRARPPEMLYHYTSAEGVLGIASSKTVWATAAQYLTDAKEMRLAIDMARGYLDGAAHLTDAAPLARLLRYMRDQLERVEHYAVCVFSLSEEGDLLSQWRGYCPPGGGYAIGFPGAELKQLLEEQDCWLARCIYDPAAHQALVKEAVDFVVSKLPLDAPEHPEELKKVGELWVPGLFQYVSQVAPLIKDQSFSEEREWRLIWIPKGQGDRYRYRARRDIFVPYVPVSLVPKSGKMVFGDVVIGPMPHQYVAMNGLTGFLKQEGVPWKAVRPSRTPYRSW